MAGIENASSSEFDMDGENIVGLMTEWSKGGERIHRNLETDLGGTMRLGQYPAILTKGSVVEKEYGKLKISERHRSARWHWQDCDHFGRGRGDGSRAEATAGGRPRGPLGALAVIVLAPPSLSTLRGHGSGRIEWLEPDDGF